MEYVSSYDEAAFNVKLVETVKPSKLGVIRFHGVLNLMLLRSLGT